ncbi:hypothetical protein C475_07185 [Halosimplex carlsbadense 2-9-1]|uniref:Integral membrane protein n=1 Tax=Halosimplex carlsbadense 2-9-1 TaxID=797114 RepID=M0CWV6_9EURY|nr:hypothetical protein C475_07185 [Halosimplex carlsbadense 2-9-1]
MGLLFAVVGVFTSLLFLGSAAVLAYWVYRDASARDANGPLWWTFLAFSGVGLVWYLAVRGERDPRHGPPSRRERLAGTWTMAMALTLVAVTVATPPDPFTKLVYLPQVFAVAFVVVYVWRVRSRPAAVGSGD